MNVLVGYTGFVGSNIYAKGCIDSAFNSRNIAEAYGLAPELLIYAGLRAEKYLANHAPEKDMELIVQAQENIRRIAPQKLVLISTVDVLRDPVGKDEDAEIETENLHAYGLNRYRLECWVRENYPNALIIRLPGLFGENLKKNFIYDYINVIPFMLRGDKFDELGTKQPALADYYALQDNGFYKVRELAPGEKKALRGMFRSLGFTALNFTDSRSVYQFYPLERLWDDIQRAIKADVRLWHPATEPISAAELYFALCGGGFENILPGTPAHYDYRTLHAELFGGSGGYICSKDRIIQSIKEFVDRHGE